MTLFFSSLMLKYGNKKLAFIVRGHNMVHEKEDKIKTSIYNICLNPGTRDWERNLFLHVKQLNNTGDAFQSDLEYLEYQLRPLANRNNLTPDVLDFYLNMTEHNMPEFDYSAHVISDSTHQEHATFAGGCFWCMVEPFDSRPGIISVMSGYMGGTHSHPSYDQILGGYTGHAEVVDIIFDKRFITFNDLVDIYWHIIDPTDVSGQFQDRGNQYRPVIFYHNEEQKKIATVSKKESIDSQKYDQPIVVDISPASTLWPAENYHQEFYKKENNRYIAIQKARQALVKQKKITSFLRTLFTHT